MKTIKIKDIVIGEGLPKVIIPLMGQTGEDLLDELEKVKNMKPDLIEWRADAFEKVEDYNSVLAVLDLLRDQLSGTPLIFTFRSHKEGGKKQITESYYIELLQRVIRSKKVELVDVELFIGDSVIRKLVSLAEEHQVLIIASNHDFTQTPAKEEIICRLRKMQDLGAHIPKIAVMPNNVQDVLTLLDATNTMNTIYADRPIITMAMGPLGIISRLSGELFGSSCTFGAGMSASAPGQIPADELRKVLEIIHKNS